MFILFLIAAQLRAEPLAVSLENCRNPMAENFSVEKDITEHGERGYREFIEADRAKILYDNVLLQISISQCVKREIEKTFGTTLSVRDLQNDVRARKQMDELAILNGRLQADEPDVREPVNYAAALRTRDLRTELDYVQSTFGDMSQTDVETPIENLLIARQIQLAIHREEALHYLEMQRPPTADQQP